MRPSPFYARKHSAVAYAPSTYRFGQILFEAVTPAQAGVQVDKLQKHWIPAFAGMSAISSFTLPGQ